MAERRGDCTLHPRLDLEQREREPPRPRGRVRARREAGPLAARATARARPDARGRGARARSRSSRTRSASSAARASAAGPGLEAGCGLRGSGGGRGQFAAQARGERLGGLAAELDPLRSRPEPVEGGRAALARPCGVGQVVLGAQPLGDEQLQLRLEQGPLLQPGAALGREGASALLVSGELERRERGLGARELLGQLRRAFGRRRLQGERPQALAHLGLEVERAFDLARDACELQLCAVAAKLEAAEAGGLLDEFPALGRARAEDGLDAALGDHGAQPAAEPDVGEELDQVDAAHRRAVDQVLPLATAMEPAGERDLGVGQARPGAGLVVEDKLDLAEVDRPRDGGARRRARRRASRRGAHWG